MSRYAAIDKNDFVNGSGICVSFWAQGCPHHCKDCHNPETWDFGQGRIYDESVKWEIIKAISDNDIIRNFSILGGEPLAFQNIFMVEDLVKAVRIAYPSIKIFLWTGYDFETIKNQGNEVINSILSKVDFIIDGLFIEEEKDLSLFLRGSRNQNVWFNDGNQWRRLMTESEIEGEIK